MKHFKCFGILFIIACVLLSMTATHVPAFHSMKTASAASTIKLNHKKLILHKKETYTLKMLGTKKKVSWSTSDQSIATVSQTGKVTAKKNGKAVITAKVKGKKYKCTVFVQKPKNQIDQEKIDEVLKLVNQERKKKGLSKLSLDTKATQAATVRAEEISRVFSHTRPNGKSCFSIFDEHAYRIEWYMLGENIAAGQPNPKKVVKAWMKSSGHGDQILEPNYNKIGIGYYYDPTKLYHHYWVQFFVKD